MGCLSRVRPVRNGAPRTGRLISIGSAGGQADQCHRRSQCPVQTLRSSRAGWTALGTPRRLARQSLRPPRAHDARPGPRMPQPPPRLLPAQQLQGLPASVLPVDDPPTSTAIPLVRQPTLSLPRQGGADAGEVVPVVRRPAIFAARKHGLAGGGEQGRLQRRVIAQPVGRPAHAGLDPCGLSAGPRRIQLARWRRSSASAGGVEGRREPTLIVHTSGPRNSQCRR